MLTKHSGGIFANGFLGSHLTSSRISCGLTKKSSASTRSHTGRTMEFGLTRNLIIFVKINDRNNQVIVIVYKMVPIGHVFLYFDGNKVSVDGVSYLDLLQKTVWQWPDCMK